MLTQNKTSRNYESTLLWISLILLYLLIQYLFNSFVLNETFYRNTWSQSFSMSRVEKMIDLNKKWNWVMYMLSPLMLTLKLLFVTFLIQARLFLSESDYTFKKIFRIVLVAEFIPLGFAIIQLGYFLFVSPSNMDDLNNFSPLSIMNFFKPNTIPGYLSYPLQSINFFEAAYWILLILGLKSQLGNSFGKNFKLVATSYGLGLLLWIVFVDFIQLQFS